MVSRADRQTEWFAAQLDDAAHEDAVSSVVVLTHIPPFLVAAEEPSGWANWRASVRRAVLQMSQQKPLPPSLFINGHFHGNVEGVHSGVFGAPLEIVTTSAVGCAMAWNGSEDNPTPHALAAAVGAEKNGSAAFLNWIVRDDAKGAPDFDLAAQRILAQPDRSGVRLFEFHKALGYRHKWHSLAEFECLAAPPTGGDATSPLKGLDFTPWAPRRARNRRNLDTLRSELRRR